MKYLFFFSLILFSENKNNDLVREDFFNTKINWTKMEMNLKISEKIPRVIIDVYDKDYGKENTAYNISEARNKTLILAREKIKIQFARSIENLILSDEGLFKDKINSSLDFRERFNEFYQNDNYEFKVKYVQDNVLLDSSLKLLGKNGLISYIDFKYNTEIFPEFLEKKNFSTYSGLILDARHLNFEPSLFPKILTDKGLEIYSNLFVDKNSVIEKGMVLYLKDPKVAMLHKRVNENPYFLLALNVIDKVNLSISTNDAIKILSNEETKKNLKKCKVIILVK